MLSDKDLLVQMERYRDIRREVENDALIQQALTGRAKRAPWLVRAIVSLQNGLVATWNRVDSPRHAPERRSVRRRA